MPNFRVRAECQPAAPLLVVDMVVDSDDCGGSNRVVEGSPRTAHMRLAVSPGFEDSFVPLRELLEWSLRSKTCLLLLLTT